MRALLLLMPLLWSCGPNVQSAAQDRQDVSTSSTMAASGSGGSGNRPQDEAIQNVTELAAAAAAAYETLKGKPWFTGLCLSSYGPVPATVPAGTAYTVGPMDFETGNDTMGWKCLHWKPSQPAIRYSYLYTSLAAGIATNNPNNSDDNGFEAAARGNLDADGSLSVFALTGEVDVETGKLTISPAGVYIENEFE